MNEFWKQWKVIKYNKTFKANQKVLKDSYKKLQQIAKKIPESEQGEYKEFINAVINGKIIKTKSNKLHFELGINK